MRKKHYHGMKRAVVTGALTASMLLSGVAPGISYARAEESVEGNASTPEENDINETGTEDGSDAAEISAATDDKEQDSESSSTASDKDGKSQEESPENTGLTETEAGAKPEEFQQEAGEAAKAEDAAGAQNETGLKSGSENSDALHEGAKADGDAVKASSGDAASEAIPKAEGMQGDKAAPEIPTDTMSGTNAASEQPAGIGDSVNPVPEAQTEEGKKPLENVLRNAPEPETESSYVLDVADMLDTMAKTQPDNSFTQKIDEAFTVQYGGGSSVDDSKKEFNDGYTGTRRINFNGKASVEANSIKIKTPGEAVLKVWWAAGGDNRRMCILDGTGKQIVRSDGESVKNSAYISKLNIAEGGTYYLGGDIGKNYIFRVELVSGEIVEELLGWDEVEAPEITKVNYDEQNNRIDVTVSAVVGSQGGDKLIVEMLDEDENVRDRKESSREADTHSFSFVPKAGGEYSFIAFLSRSKENDKYGNKSDVISYTLPVGQGKIKSLVNKGKGSVLVRFYATAEAEHYKISLIDKTDGEAAEIVKSYTSSPEQVLHNLDDEPYEHELLVEGLVPGHRYSVSITGYRGDEPGMVSEEKEISVSAEAEYEWVYASFGSNATSDRSKNGFSIEEKDGEKKVSVWSLGNSGKLVPASTDGLAFYYTPIPSNKNFTLTATAEVDFWTFTNGQEGFGLMAADRVGRDGIGGSFWNNSYMASGTKVQYNYDAENGEASDNPAHPMIVMKLGLGSQEKTGVTKNNMEGLEAKDSAAVSQFKSSMLPLETSCGEKGAGTYNLFGRSKEGVSKLGDEKNAKDQELIGTVDEPVVRVRLQIQKNNTGYFVSYLSEDGKELLATNKYYDTEALSRLDEDYVYAGFFASRSFKASFSDIELKLIDPEDDAPAEERKINYVTPNYRVTSSSHANSENYNLQFVANADGKVSIWDGKGRAVAEDMPVKNAVYVNQGIRLSAGENIFRISFTPDEDYHPGNDEFSRLSSYDTAELVHKVEYLNRFSGFENIYVSQEGRANGEGSEQSPVDIYTAVKYVRPGQTIYLNPGEYRLEKAVLIDRGIDGTADKPIKMLVNGEEGERAVFDFSNKSAGFIFVGNYWYVKGIDATNSSEGTKGIQLCGSHNTFEDVRTYRNRNTGFQVSRYLATDSRDLWPSYNLIKNCTSFANADKGFEDADGFAAKLTVGQGVVFDGCIAYNNADDGWDLFAKVETGRIGAVTIQNSMAFGNGYGLDGQDQGNGNGFKMGGESITGNHRVINSIAWNNKAKGIDSNSCPDIEIYNSTSYNNGGENVALYTNDAKNTGYKVNGVFSYRDNKSRFGEKNDKVAARGSQPNDSSDIYGIKSFFRKGGKSLNTGDNVLEITAEDLESFTVPVASAAEPLRVADELRTADGRIDAGMFILFNTAGEDKLSAAGISSAEISAILNGEYDALDSAEDIPGAREDSERRASGGEYIEIGDEEQDEPDELEEQKPKQDTENSKKQNETDVVDKHSYSRSSSGRSYSAMRREKGSYESETGSVRTYTKKGLVDSVLGLVTGGSGNAAWTRDDKGWRLGFADKTMATGSVVRDEQGREHEQIAWERVNGHWYAFGADGYIKTGWVLDYSTGIWYYLSSDDNTAQPLGSMLHGGRTPDGYTVDASGAWDGKPAQK